MRMYAAIILAAMMAAPPVPTGVTVSEAASGSGYPASLDTFSDYTTNSDVTITDLNKVRSAVENIEAELGTDPAGASATVAARLAALDPQVTGIYVCTDIVADGVTDDTTAFHNCLDNAAVPGRGRFILPAGEILITDQYDYPEKAWTDEWDKQGAIIEGQGINKTVILFTPGAAKWFMRAAPTTGNLINSVKLANLTVAVQDATASGVLNLDATTGSIFGWRIDDVNFLGFSNNGVGIQLQGEASCNCFHAFRGFDIADFDKNAIFSGFASASTWTGSILDANGTVGIDVFPVGTDTVAGGRNRIQLELACSATTACIRVGDGVGTALHNYFEIQIEGGAATHILLNDKADDNLFLSTGFNTSKLVCNGSSAHRTFFLTTAGGTFSGETPWMGGCGSTSESLLFRLYNLGAPYLSFGQAAADARLFDDGGGSSAFLGMSANTSDNASSRLQIYGDRESSTVYTAVQLEMNGTGGLIRCRKNGSPSVGDVPCNFGSTMDGQVNLQQAGGTKIALEADGDIAITPESGRSVIMAEHQQFTEVTAPGAAPANGARLFAQDNGAGKTQLCARFATGAVQCFATEP